MADKTDDLIISISTDLATVKRSLNRLVGDIGQASGQITKQFDSVGKSIDKSMTTALQSRINGMVGIGQQAVREWNGALADQGKELDRLRAKYNPLFATINSYKAAKADIRTLYQSGAISIDEYNAALSRERQATLASISAIKARATAQADAATAADVAATAAYAAELNRLRAKFDPLVSAANKYTAALSEIATAERMGAISASQAIDARAKETASYNAQISKLGELAAAKKRAAEALVSGQTISPNRGADIEAYGRELDSLRAKFSPLYAAQQLYVGSLREIKSAHAVGAISADEMTAAIQRQKDAFTSQVAAIKGRNAAIADTPVHRAVNGNMGAFQTANIAAQFQDIAVTSAMGMSPLQIALQQGTQLSMALGENGAAGSVKALGAAFLSIVSPVSLVTIGLVAGAAALIQYATSGEDSTKKVDAVLAQHTENIKAIKDAYGEAAAGLQEYVRESQATIRANAQQTLDAARDIVADAAGSKIRDALSLPASAFAGNINVIDQFRTAINDLKASVDDGRPNLLAYRTALSEIANSDDASAAQKKLANELRNLDDETLKAVRSLPMMEAAVSTIGGAASSQVDGVSSLSKALQELSQIALPALDDAGRARAAYERALQSDPTSRSAQLAYDAALERIRNQNPTINGVAVPTPESRPNTESMYPGGTWNKPRSSRANPKTADDRFAEDIQAIRDRSAALQQEIGLIGLSYEEQTKRRTALDLEQKALADLREEARKKGQTDLDSIKLSPEKIAAIEQESAAYAAQAEALRQAQEANQLMSDVTRGFVHDLLNGTSAAESFANALSKIADKLIDDVLDSILQVNGASSGGGGLLGSLFGSLFGGGQLGVAKAGGIGMYAKGTDFAPGGLAVVGEQGPELVNLPRGSQVVPNHRIPSLIDRSASDASPSITYAPVIDARGADSAAVARLEQIMAKERAEFSAKVIDTVKNGQRRRIL